MKILSAVGARLQFLKAAARQLFTGWQSFSTQLLALVSGLKIQALQRQARVVLTNSGGLQKEAFYLRTPILMLMAESDWPETIDLAWNHLLGIYLERLGAVSRCVLGAAKSSASKTFYGEGDTASKIAHCSYYV